MKQFLPHWLARRERDSARWSEALRGGRAITAQAWADADGRHADTFYKSYYSWGAECTYGAPVSFSPKLETSYQAHQVLEWVETGRIQTSPGSLEVEHWLKHEPAFDLTSPEMPGPGYDAQTRTRWCDEECDTRTRWCDEKCDHHVHTVACGGDDH